MIKIYTAKEIESSGCGVTAREISCMIRAGYTPSHGTKMTLESVMAWKAENQHFRPSHFYGKAPLSPRELKRLYPNVRPLNLARSAAAKKANAGRSNTDQALSASLACKSGEPSLTHG